MDDKIKQLEKMVDELSNQVGIHDDIQSIRNLQHIYGYYLDKCLYNEVVDLFAEDSEVHFMGGIYKGKEGARRLYIERFQKNFTNGHNGPLYGFLLDHLIMQDVIHVSSDRSTANARFRCFMQAGLHENAGGNTRQWWEGGLYENEYVKEEGIWKFKKLDYRGLWHADFDKGWAYTSPNLYPFASKTREEDPNGPDELITDPKPVLWPDTDVFPFHYNHPVTGEKWEDSKSPQTLK